MLRVLLVLVAVACIVDVGEALFKNQPSKETKEYLQQLNQKIAARKLNAKKEYSVEYSEEDSDDIYGDYYYDYSYEYCPLWDCYWNCEDFTSCVATAKASDNYCLCSLDDIMGGNEPMSCGFYASMYSMQGPDSTANNCSGCLRNMDMAGFYGDSQVAFSCDKRQKLEEARTCFQNSQDGDKCLTERFGMAADMIFTGMSLQIDGCPIEEIHYTCLEKNDVGYFYGSALQCSGSDAEVDAKIQELSQCGKDLAGRIEACDIDNHADLVAAGADALKTMVTSVCDARAAAVQDKKDNCSDCSAADKRSKKVQLKMALKELLGLIKN